MNDRLLEIPGYSVHGRLGKGGMAEVYLATQESLHRKVAVKVLRSADDEAFSKRFIKEGHIVASLHHPSIITIHDIDKLADGRHYLAMEFVAGGDLAQHKGEVFEPQRALAIVRQIASGLAVVHEKGLVHRDIKPANILFRDDGTVVISDFGIAKELELDNELTQFNIAVGSPAYSSPEQAQCQPLDARSDIYSLGVILLEMLSGANPYRGSSYTQTVMNHVQMELPSLPAHLSQYQNLLERMLAKDPDERFADCRVLLASLAELSEAELDHTRLAPALSLERPGKQRAATGGRSTPVRLLWALLGLLLVGVAGGAGYYVHQQMKIADFLARGEQRLAEGKLLEPAQDNADYFFRQVLLLDEANADAESGLQRVLEARVAGYLQLAERSIAEERLLLPEDNSAVFYYRQVLGWVPGQEQALAGLQRVAQHYIDQSEGAYARREYALALEYIKHGLEAQPDNEVLLKLYDDHEQRVRKARATRPRATNSSSSQEQKQPNAIKRLWNRLFDN
ncbi:serine/threonine protein kinase [Pseudomonas cavernae]|uniref:Serine/threonine protein kinase n=1 Tax=Pseudomonas cavernae TaxID=2320867 RepID=A0A385Z2C1_9PSED|nr:serine/threonine-protein kinase [Pseudomonas cavernae]AYC32277.1 serine/threonine protein kinase [Pseudomonas cavernae]